MLKDKDEEFPRLTKYVIINKPVIIDQIEEDKRRAIKRIMAIVDTQIRQSEVHGHIRKAVLDGVNDMARSFSITLERVVEKIEPTLVSREIKPAPTFDEARERVEQRRRIQELGNPEDLESPTLE
jgi:hypothetical protein